MKKLIVFSMIFFSSFVFAGADILQYVTSPISVGQGNMSTVINDNSVLSVNQSPANLGFIKKPGTAILFNRVANNFNFVNIAGVYPFSGALALSLSYLNYGQDLVANSIDSLGNVSYGNSVTSYDAVVGLGYGKNFNQVYFGVDGKYIISTLAGDQKTYMSADVNLLYRLGENKNLGLSLKNLGFSETITLPSYVAFGGGYSLLEMKGKHVILSLLGEGRYYLDDYQLNKIEGTLGVQYIIAGFKFNISSVLYNNAKFISLAGLGVSYAFEGPIDLQINYAFDATSQIVGANHSISVSYFFNVFKKEKTNKVRKKQKKLEKIKTQKIQESIEPESKTEKTKILEEGIEKTNNLKIELKKQEKIKSEQKTNVKKKNSSEGEWSDE